MTVASQATNIKVLLAKLGLDGHDRGIKVIAKAMRDAGMEVVYMGMRITPDQVAQTALQEDVDVIGLSILSGAHMTLFPKVADLLKKEGAEHILLTGGGIISDADMKDLQSKGVGKLFGPGTTLAAIVDYVKEEVSRRRSNEGRDQEDVAK